MINVKDQVYAALRTCAENVTDMYPSDWETMPAIEYREEQNSVYEFTDGEEQKSKLRYAIFLWDTKSLSELALKVDKALSALGLIRTACNDADDPSRRRHKVMRYEGILDNESEHVYFNYNN